MAAWIESDILLQLASAPFDKQDETLVPESGSCANCPKRTGFNKLLFPDVRKDSCKLCGIWFWFWGWGLIAVFNGEVSARSRCKKKRHTRVATL